MENPLFATWGISIKNNLERDINGTAAWMWYVRWIHKRTPLGERSFSQTYQRIKRIEKTTWEQGIHCHL